MTRPVLFLVSAAIASFAPAARGEGPFTPYLKCIKAVRVCSKGRSVSISGDSPTEMVLLIGYRGGAQAQQGFYAYAEDDAWFHAFPPGPRAPFKPYVAPPKTFWNLYGLLTAMFNPPPPALDPYFYFKLDPGLHDTVYLGFERLPAGDVVLSTASMTPMPAKNINYLPGTGGECHADAEARELILRDTVARIQSVNATWAGAPRPPKGDVSEEYNLVGREIRVNFDREECLKTLDACGGAEDLRLAATAEKEKFK